MGFGRITTTRETSSYPVKTGSAPFGITVGPDDALWFTAIGTDQIARITVDGHLTEFPLPTSGAMASMITTGPDGALWLAPGDCQQRSDHERGPGGSLAELSLPSRGSFPVLRRCVLAGAP